MYSWIWRHLPFGLPGKITGSLLIVGALAALFWYAIFPNIEQYMPFTDGQVTSSDDGGGPGADTVHPSASANTSIPPADVIPYSTVSNAPEPTKTKSR
jgi:hypothetical protein